MQQREEAAGSAAGQPMRQFKARYRTLDAWRGVACLGVLAYHAALYREHQPGSVLQWLVQQGWLGVPLFFVISGYCIAASARRAGTAGDFIRRRFVRIYPTYWIVVLGTVVLLEGLTAAGQELLYADAQHPLAPPHALSALQWLGNLGLWEMWRPHLFHTERRFLLGTAWTLCYEEQFYVLAAGAVIFARRWQGLAFGLITVAVLGIQVVAWKLGKITTGFFFDGSWLLFWAGVLVYQWRTTAQRWARYLIPAALLGLGLLPAAAPAPCALNGQLPIGLPVAAGFSLLLLGLSYGDDELQAHPVIGALSWCGVRCYSIYLLHWPVTKLLSHLAWKAGLQSEAATLGITLPLCLASSLLLAAWFYERVERRFLSSGSASPESGRAAA